MEALPVIKVSVGGLGLRFPAASKPSLTGVHSASSPCFCEISFPYVPPQVVPVTLVSATSENLNSHATAASFYVDETLFQKIMSSSWLKSPRKKLCLKVVVVTGRQGSCLGVRAGKKIGSFRLPIALELKKWTSAQIHSGWIGIKDDGKAESAQLHLRIRVESDSRYVFQFDEKPSLSPQIVQGAVKQPIFSCKFIRDSRTSRIEVGLNEALLANAQASRHYNGDSEKQRRGWLVVIHDLSGSPVAAAAMVIPFVPSRWGIVSRSSRGAWLILRPEQARTDRWKSWGRLEAWRERGVSGRIGCRFQLNSEGGGIAAVSAGRLVSETILSARNGGEFSLDTNRLKEEGTSPVSPTISRRSNTASEFSFAHVLPSAGSFVFKTSVKGERLSTRPFIQLAMRHVSCVHDAAVFMALAAALDLSVDACKPFSRKLRPELTKPPSPPSTI